MTEVYIAEGIRANVQKLVSYLNNQDLHFSILEVN